MGTTDPTDPHAPYTSSPTELERLNALEGQTFVTWRDSKGALQIKVLEPTLPQVSIGRAAHRDIALEWDPLVSRMHAELQPRDRDWVVLDTNSTDGTYIADNPVIGVQPLMADDRIRVGNTILAFHAPIAEGAGGTLTRERALPKPLTEVKKAVLVALCEPLMNDLTADPTPNAELAQRFVVSKDAIKRTLRFLCDQFEIGDVPSKRRDLALKAIRLGVVRESDYRSRRG